MAPMQDLDGDFLERDELPDYSNHVYTNTFINSSTFSRIIYAMCCCVKSTTTYMDRAAYIVSLDTDDSSSQVIGIKNHVGRETH